LQMTGNGSNWLLGDELQTSAITTQLTVDVGPYRLRNGDAACDSYDVTRHVAALI
jgi:hypothetical protein